MLSNEECNEMNKSKADKFDPVLIHYTVDKSKSDADFILIENILDEVKRRYKIESNIPSSRKVIELIDKAFEFNHAQTVYIQYLKEQIPNTNDKFWSVLNDNQIDIRKYIIDKIIEVI